MVIVKQALRQPLIWCFFLFAALLIVNGPAFTDGNGLFFAQMASHPLKLMFSPIWQFLYSSPLNVFIAAALRLNSVVGFYIIHMIEIIMMLICIGIAVQKKITTPDAQLRFITLLALTPLWLVTIKWIGKPDPVLIGLLFLSWAFQTRWRIVFALLMVLAHREVGTLLCLFLFFLEERKDHNLIIGILLGNGLQYLYQYGLMDHPPMSREEGTFLAIEQDLKAFLPIPVLYVMTMFSWYWLVLFTNRPRPKEMCVIGVAAFLALISEDFTRDFILAALPAVLFHLERIVKLPQNNKFDKLAPLTLFHFQIAALGQIFMPYNMFIRLWAGL